LSFAALGRQDFAPREYRPRVTKEHAMRRTPIGTVLSFIFSVVALVTTGGLTSGQFLDPSPTVDERFEQPDYEAELPAPPQSVERVEPIRDFSQAYLGVTFDPQYPNAAVARSVNAGSPADQAGIKAGDTIISVNGRKVASYDDVLKSVDRLKPGDVLDIDVSRRVSVKARAVLDGQPVGARTSNYRPVSEPLPEPEFAPVQTRPRSLLLPGGQNSIRPRQNYGAPQNSSNSVNRNNNSIDRDSDNRGRGRLPRRRG
jgi:membrane-associated protease RseP (regulator of RpoE activity)